MKMVFCILSAKAWKWGWVIVTVALIAVPFGAGQSAYAEEYVPVKVNCTVYHSGYKGTVVAPRISVPSGKVVKLECNGKDVDITNNDMVDGYIATKAFGKVKVRFESDILTVGAGDFILVQEGVSIPERAKDVSVPKSTVKTFTADFSKQK